MPKDPAARLIRKLTSVIGNVPERAHVFAQSINTRSTATDVATPPDVQTGRDEKAQRFTET